jgi:fibro-slime domain-containing protein
MTFNETSNVPYYFSSSDDMWIFINGKRVDACRNLAGIHAETSCTVDLKVLKTKLGLVNDAVNNGIYRCDIYFASRGSDRVPSIKMQRPKTVLCDALSTGIVSFNYNFTRGASTFNLVAGTNVTGLGSFGSIDSSGLNLISSQNAAAAYYASNAQGLIPVKVLQGFECTFTFQQSGLSAPFATLYFRPSL